MAKQFNKEQFFDTLKQGSTANAAKQTVGNFNANRVAIGQGALDIISKSPGQNFQTFDPSTGKNTGMLDQTGDYGMAGNLFRGIVSPFTQAGELGLAEGEARRRSRFLESGMDVSNYKPSIISQQDFQDFIEDPTAARVKAGLSLAGGVGSLLGGGIPGAVASGVAIGAGQAERGKELEGALGGGAVAGTVAGGLGLLGKAAQRFAGGTDEVATLVQPKGGLGQKLQRSAIGDITDTSPTGFFKSQELQDEAINILKTNAPKEAVSPKAVNVAFNKLNSELETAVKGSKAIFDPEVIITNAKNTLSTEIDDITTGAVSKNIDNLTKKLGSVANNAEGLARFKFDLQNQMSGVYRKLGSGLPLTPKEQSMLAFRNAASDVLGEIVPESRGILRQMSTLHEVSPAVFKEAEKGTRIGLGPLGPGVNISGAAQKAKSTVGRLLEGGPLPGIGAAKQATQNILANPTAQAAGQVASRLGPLAAIGSMNQIPEQINQEPDMLSESTAISPQQTALQQLIMQNPVLAYEMGIWDPRGGNSSTKLSATQQDTINDLQTSISSLDNLRQTIRDNSGRFGPVQGGALGDFVGSTLGLDPQRASIKTEIDTLAQIIGKALEGGKLAESDIQRYRLMLPSLSDPAEVAIAKLDKTQQLLSAQLEGRLN